MAMSMRWLRHLFASVSGPSLAAGCLDRFAAVIGEGELRHEGEVVFAIEAGLPWSALRAGVAARERAHEVFTRLRVWDTRANNGVLLYVLLADRAIEIVADRGLHGQVSDAQWASVCAAVKAGMETGDVEQAVTDGLQRIAALLATQCPATDRLGDELPDRPVLL